MKKTAMLAALALGVNCLVCPAYAEETTAYTYETDFSAINSEGWSQQFPDSNWSSSRPGGANHGYKKVDDEHGMSFQFNGGADDRVEVKLSPDGGILNGEERVSFDMRMDAADAGLVFGVNKAWKNTCAQIQGNQMNITQQDGANGEIPVGMWNRMDFVIKSAMVTENNAEKRSTSVDIYLNGKYFGTRNLGPIEVTELSFAQYSARKTAVWIDNFSMAAPKNAAVITGAMNGTKIKFNKTLDRSSFEDNSVVLTEVNLDDNSERVIDITSELDVSGSAIIVSETEYADDCKYVYTLPGTLTGLCGETISTKTFNKYGKVSYFANFNNYKYGDAIPTKGRVGIWEGGYKTRDESSLKNITFRYGWGDNTQKGLNKPHMALVTPASDSVTSGKVAISFDLARGANNPYFYLTAGDFTSTVDNTNIIFFETVKKADDGTLSGGALSTGGWMNNKTGYYHMTGEWKHYDFIFNVGKNVDIYQDQTKIATVSYTGYPDYLFFADPDNSGFEVNNVHIREFGTNKITTTLDGAVMPGTTTATISFENAVDPAQLTADKFTLSDADLNEYEVTVESADKNSVTISFPAVTEGIGYILEIGDITTYLGETLSRNTIEFTPIEKHFVNDIYAADADGNKIETVAGWANAKTINIRVDSNRPECRVYVFAAGYKAEKMVGVTMSEITVNGSGVFSADIENADMPGADTIKYFAVDSLANLAPLTNGVTAIH